MIYPWHQKQLKQLRDQLKQERLPHALLFEGPVGMGKLNFAESFSQEVLCEKHRENGCGVCRSCELLAVGNHPDYFRIYPEEESKAIKVQQVRDLIDELSQHSHQGHYQVAIISPADSMNRAASNALLKTLEEPVGKVLIILVTNRMHVLPATVVSRCQKIQFLNPPAEITQSWLSQSLGTREGLDFLLSSADQAPLKALELAQANYQELRDQVLSQLIGIKSNEVNAVKLASQWSKLDLDALIKILQSLLMDLIRLNFEVDFKYLFNSDHIQKLLELKDSATLDHWFQVLKELLRVRELFLSSNNVNQQMLLESFLLKL